MLAPRRYTLAGTLVIALSWLVGCSNDAQAPARPVASVTLTRVSVSGSAAITVVTASSGSVSFATVEAGAYHTCGRTAGGAAYCWGFNGWGQLGDGSIVSSLVPGPVTGGFTYASVSLGGIHACGLTAGGAAYCWGADVYASRGAGA